MLLVEHVGNIFHLFPAAIDNKPPKALKCSQKGEKVYKIRKCEACHLTQ